jgi:hypothetical protein
VELGVGQRAHLQGPGLVLVPGQDGLPGAEVAAGVDQRASYS